MSERVRARFLPAFVATARAHVRRGLEHAGRGEAELVFKALHTLAGDASLFAIESVAAAARPGEAAARRWLARPDDRPEAEAVCVSALEAVSRALDDLELGLDPQGASS